MQEIKNLKFNYLKDGQNRENKNQTQKIDEELKKFKPLTYKSINNITHKSWIQYNKVNLYKGSKLNV